MLGAGGRAVLALGGFAAGPAGARPSCDACRCSCEQNRVPDCDHAHPVAFCKSDLLDC
jgi:hypothetical protein